MPDHFEWCLQVYRTLKAGPYTRALAFEQEGTYLASLSAEGHLQVWDVATGKADCNMPKSAPKVYNGSAPKTFAALPACCQ